MDKPVEQALRQILKEARHSATNARIMVCRELLDQEPITITKLAARLQGKVDRASVYRTVALFEQLGIIHRVYIGWKYKIELSDRLTHHHHHISCLNCGRVQPLDDETTAERAIAQIAQKYGFQASTHQLEIQGLCQNCQTAPGRR